MEAQMQTQQSYVQVRQSVVLAILLATLLAGGIGGYAVRGAENAQSGSTGTALIPREAREGSAIAPIQAPAPRWTHEDDTTSR